MFTKNIKVAASATLALGMIFNFGNVAAYAAEQPGVTTVHTQEQDIDAATIEQVARVFEAMDKAETADEVYEIFVENFGEESVAEAAATLGVTVDELFYGRAVSADATRLPRDVHSFLRCMKDEATSDLKSIFDIQPIAALIGQKNYLEAAKKAVTHLAKQGIKRNAAGVAASLGYYGLKCRGHW